MSSVARLRDGLMELAHDVNEHSKVCGVFPMKEGAFIRVAVESVEDANSLMSRIKARWPLLNVSSHASALDAAIEVGVMVPNKCTAWWKSLELARSGFFYSSSGAMAQSALFVAVVAFFWLGFQALKV